MKICAALLLSLMLASVPDVAGAFQPAMTVLDLDTLATGRPAKINLWYPQGDCPAGSAMPCLADDAITDRVLVFSHGTMGSAEDYSWLAESLAAGGFLVVGVNHYAESRLYGSATQDPRSIPQIWQRAQDISAILDRLAAQPVFRRPVAWDYVVMMGHSAGGQTAALLAGARFDLRQMIAYCMSAAAAPDRSCNYGRGLGDVPESFVARYNASYADRRVQALLLLDPALGAALQRDSLRDVVLPALVVGATQTDFLPWDQHGARYAAALPGARTILLNGGEGHFVFLSPCQHDVQVMGVPLCGDRPGVDRRAVQQGLARQIADFLRSDTAP